MQLIYQIDAFTSSVFRGNPAAVMPLESWPDDEVLQSVAAENNLSETAFFRSTEESGVFELRWFTPTVEVPLCGHATLATAFVILTEVAPHLERVAFETRSGRLTVRRSDGRLAMDFPALEPRTESCPEGVVAAVGSAPSAVLKSNYWLFVYEQEADVAGLDVDSYALAAALAEDDADAGVICTAPSADGRAEFVSRFFAPCHGIPEDPVTGSAHCSLVPYWSERLGLRDLRALQISPRGGELYCRNLGDRVEIAGNAVKYMAGAVEVPMSSLPAAAAGAGGAGERTGSAIRPSRAAA